MLYKCISSFFDLNRYFDINGFRGGQNRKNPIRPSSARKPKKLVETILEGECPEESETGCPVGVCVGGGCWMKTTVLNTGTCLHT